MSDIIKNERRKRITANVLKIIAIVTMFIDHIGAAVLEKTASYVNAPLPLLVAIEAGNANTVQLLDYIFRMIGRIAFPIFCFLIVQGFIHTRSVKKYAIRLFIFALISEIPFNFAFYGRLFNPNYQNVFFTLVIGLFVIWGMNFIQNNHLINDITKMIVKIVIAAIGILIAEYLCTDYSGKGVLLIIILYLLNDNRLMQCVIGAISFLWEPTSMIAFIIMYFYNGEKGKQLNKYFFYAFYPVHLLILHFILLMIS